jgi:hypothetical protein
MAVEIQPLRGNRWLIEMDGGVTFIVDSAELDDMAQALAPRLKGGAIVRYGGGIGLALGGDRFFHLCFSDELDALIRQLERLRTIA